jgi:hypothetical protein
MAETEASIGYGSKIEISQDGGSTWQPGGEVNDITPPSNSVDLVDATHMQSPNGDKEYILGLNDPGECSFTLNFVPGSTADQMYQAVKAARERVKVRITYPNLVTWTFSGLLTAYNPSIPTADKMTATVTFKVSGSTVVG